MDMNRLGLVRVVSGLLRVGSVTADGGWLRMVLGGSGVFSEIFSPNRKFF